MKTMRLILFILLLLPVSLKAQKARLVNATMQGWSGGIAGRSGENYMFVVEFESGKNELIPDTLWIGDSPIFSMQENTQVEPTKKGVRIQINASTSRDEYAERMPKQGEEKHLPKPPFKYNGVALLSYTYKGAHHYYAISRIMKTYPPANYP